LLGRERFDALDRVERAQLREVIEVCGRSRSLSDAGRTLYAVSRARKTRANDADRLRKYLDRYGIDWRDILLGAGV